MIAFYACELQSGAMEKFARTKFSSSYFCDDNLTFCSTGVYLRVVGLPTATYILPESLFNAGNFFQAMYFSIEIHSSRNVLKIGRCRFFNFRFARILSRNNTSCLILCLPACHAMFLMYWK